MYLCTKFIYNVFKDNYNNISNHKKGLTDLPLYGNELSYIHVQCTVYFIVYTGMACVLTTNYHKVYIYIHNIKE